LRERLHECHLVANNGSLPVGDGVLETDFATMEAMLIEKEDISKSVEKKLRAFRDSDAMREAFITVSNSSLCIALLRPECHQ